MEFKQVVEARKSIRDYTDQPVSAEDLRDIVETAGRAASWCNAQPWKVYAVRGETLGRISEEWGKRLAAETPMEMDFEGIHREEMTELASANMGGFFEVVGPYLEAGTMAPQVLYGAPTVLILTVPGPFIAPVTLSPYALRSLIAFGSALSAMISPSALTPFKSLSSMNRSYVGFFHALNSSNTYTVCRAAS